MRTYKDRTGRFICEQFADIYEFLDTIEERPVNNAFKKHRGETKDLLPSRRASESFTGTASWEAAHDLMERGYEEGVNLILNAGMKPTGGTLHRYETAVVGFAPCIPNAIMGLPDSMIRNREHKQQMREVTINYAFGLLGGSQAEDIAIASRRLLDAIASLEKDGIRVKLNLHWASKRDEHVRCVSITLKEARQPINLRKISYPLVHPSFLRRHLFAWMETAPNIRVAFTEGYGGRVSDETQRAYMMQTQMMQPTDYFISTFTLAELSSAEDVIKYFQKQSNGAKRAI